jgi:hypothetical protein
MSTPMDVGTLLVWEGALVLGTLALRTICLRLVDPATIPARLGRRIRIGTRLAPAVTALSLAMIAMGTIIRFVP